MTRLLMLVEGQSEEIFVKRVLAPHLEQHGVYVAPTLLWTKRLVSGSGFRGGVSSWGQIRRDLQALTKDTDAWVSTLLDFHGLPDDFPGYQDAHGVDCPHKKVVALQGQFAKQIGHARFIPFLALHEFEAWLFSDPEAVATHFGDAMLAEQLHHAVQKAGAPELINHGKQTHPKARLQGLDCGYKETSDGPTLMGKIGIATIRKACPHFSGWLERLEQLGDLGGGHGDTNAVSTG